MVASGVATATPTRNASQGEPSQRDRKETSAATAATSKKPNNASLPSRENRMESNGVGTNPDLQAKAGSYPAGRPLQRIPVPAAFAHPCAAGFSPTLILGAPASPPVDTTPAGSTPTPAPRAR